jgi:hypothetical protein
LPEHDEVPCERGVESEPIPYVSSKTQEIPSFSFSSKVLSFRG